MAFLKMKRRARRKMQRYMNKGPEITLTPLIDVALTLLVIFMITTPMLTNVIKIDLPESHSKDKVEQLDKFIIYIDKNEKIYLNNDEIKEENLLKELKDIVGNQTDQTIVVKGDREIHYGKLIDIYDKVKDIGGFQYVALATQKAY